VKKAENRNEAGCSREDRLETESNRGVRSGGSLERTEENGAVSLLAYVLARENLNRAYARVKKNGGAPGIDGMTTDELLEYLKSNGVELVTSISQGRYRPQPVRRVEILKPDGGIRELGVPTVVDRVIQLAIAQALEPIFEPEFSDGSYGFRPGRNAHQAIRKTREYYDEGYTEVVDIDLAKYFDTINHDLLINMLREKVKDENLISLIRKCLKSGVMAGGIYSPTIEGSTQGSPLSPLLSNVYLTKFDRFLESGEHKFVRYADDCNIYVRSHRAGLRVMSGCKRYLEKVLKLKVNEEKSTVGSPLRLKFLGFSLYKGHNGTRIRIHTKPLKRFKSKLKAITHRNRGVSVVTVLNNLKSCVRGWLGYYAIADMKEAMRKMTEWVRRRIRMYIWKQWKRVSTRFTRLKELGVTKEQAWQWANTRKGYWRISNSHILKTTLTNERLANLGFENISKRYEALHSSY
jgi:group II intron reverse transcriptase/maturase